MYSWNYEKKSWSIQINIFETNRTSGTIFLQATDKEEITIIISSFHSNKASRPNSMPYKILFLLNNEVLKKFEVFLSWLVSFLLCSRLEK